MLMVSAMLNVFIECDSTDLEVSFATPKKTGQNKGVCQRGSSDTLLRPCGLDVPLSQGVPETTPALS